MSACFDRLISHLQCYNVLFWQNPIKKKVTPWIDMKKLNKIYGDESCTIMYRGILVFQGQYLLLRINFGCELDNWNELEYVYTSAVDISTYWLCII